MDVFVANEQDVPVDETRLSSLARHTLSVEEVDEEAELSVLLVGPDHIRRLNARFAGQDHATDVLAFPMADEEELEVLLGDVVICPRIAQDNAQRLNHSLESEIDTLAVHGILHLLGYDHQGADDRAAMDGRLREILDTFVAAIS